MTVGSRSSGGRVGAEISRRVKECAFALVVLWAAIAQAQPSLPDAIVLQNGAMLRGTVTEVVRGQHVTVTLATGSSRTFAWDEVRYAGPADERPPVGPVPPPPGAPASDPADVAPGVESASGVEPASALGASRPSNEPPSGYSGHRPGSEPSSPVRASAVPVTVRAEPGADPLTLYQHSDEAIGFGRRGRPRRLCSIPCQANLEPGSYRFALSSGGTPRSVDGAVEVSGPTSLLASYHGRRALRTAGWILLIAANVVGAVVYSILTANDPPRTDGDLVRPLLISGGIAAAGTAGGLAMILSRDQVSLEPVN